MAPPEKSPLTPPPPKRPLSRAKSKRLTESPPPRRIATSEPEKPSNVTRSRFESRLTGDPPRRPARRGPRSSAPPCSDPPGVFQSSARPVGQSGSRVGPSVRLDTRSKRKLATVQR